MEKHSYLMMMDNEHSILKLLKQFAEMESSQQRGSNQAMKLLSMVSDNIPNLVLWDITLPSVSNEDSLEMIQNCAGTSVIKVSAKCEIATLGEALGMIVDSNSANESLQSKDSLSLLMADINKGAKIKFSEN